MKVKARKTPEPRGWDVRKRGVSVSRLIDFMTCREYANLSAQGWTQMRRVEALDFGTIGHRFQERMYLESKKRGDSWRPDREWILRVLTAIEKAWEKKELRGASVRDIEQTELLFGLHEVLMPTYSRFWSREDFGPNAKWEALELAFGPGEEHEVFVDTDEGPIPLVGKMDGLRRPGPKTFWVHETKFKSKIDEGSLIDGLGLDLQVMVYLYAVWKMFHCVPKGIVYNVIRRPGQKMTKADDGSLTKLLARIEVDVKKRPEHYFKRFEIAITKSEIVEYMPQVGELVGDFIRWWEGRGPHYRNGSACVGKWTCRMLPICAHNDFTGHRNWIEERKAEDK